MIVVIHSVFSLDLAWKMQECHYVYRKRKAEYYHTRGICVELIDVHWQ